MGRRDRGEQSEHLLIALDTFLDRRTAYVFGVTASGVRLDRFHQRDDETTFDEGFDPVWEAKTSIDAQGWTAELWIPFSQLRFNEGLEHVWGLNVHRFTPTLNEDDYWAPIPRTVTAWSSRFGDLSGLKGLTASRRLELLPYVAGASTLTANRDPANPFDTGANLKGRAGADLKMGVGPNLTLDATFNPDFGQVEADPAEVNLSAFETFFTEKRPFFLEGAPLLNLAAVVNIFYSRRVGAPPTVPVTGDFVDYPTTSTIVAAGKLTGRLASGTSVGMFAAVTNEETASIFNRAAPAITNVRVAPRTTYAVAHVQQEFGANKSTVSGMITEVHRDLASGDPLAALLVRNAFTVAGDSTLHLKGGEYQVVSYGAASFLDGEAAAVARVQQASAHYAQRPDRDYALYDPTRTSLPGFKTGTSLQRIGGRHWIWTATTDIESPSFETNDIGRLTAADGMQEVYDLHYRETVPKQALRAYAFGIKGTQEWDFGRDHDIATSQLYATETWKNLWTSQVTYTANARHEDPRLTRGGPRMQVPSAWSIDALLRNNTSSQTSWSGEVILGGTEDGGLTHQVIGHLGFRPGPRWQLSVDPNFLHQVDTQQYVTTANGGGAQTYGKRYVFGTIDRSTYSTSRRRSGCR